MTYSFRSNVVAVVVTYQPELEVLEQLLDTLVMQVGSIVVVDNGSNANLEAWNSQRQTPTVEVLLLGENKGIAAAHNAGIRCAMDSGAGYVLLIDQDSMPAQDMVKKLMHALQDSEIKSEGRSIAAGPVRVDSRTGTKSFFLIERNGKPSSWHPTSYQKDLSVEVSFLISSGTVINLQRLLIVGNMRDSYFIDHVDTEWCFRARSKGFTILGVPSAEMKHSLGDSVTRVWFLRWRNVPYHSPLRDYYIFRNTLLMLRDVKMRISWRVHFLWILVKLLIYFMSFVPNRMQRLRFMFLGIVDGLRDVRGKMR